MLLTLVHCSNKYNKQLLLKKDRNFLLALFKQTVTYTTSSKEVSCVWLKYYFEIFFVSDYAKNSKCLLNYAVFNESIFIVMKTQRCIFQEQMRNFKLQMRINYLASSHAILLNVSSIYLQLVHTFLFEISKDIEKR